MPIKFKAFVTLFIYLTIAVPLTIYYGNNFSRFVHSKGQEFFNYVLVLVTTNILFNVAVWSSTGFNVLMRLLTPLIICLVSFILGLIVWQVTDITGIPRHLIFIYGGSHLSIFTLGTIVLAFKFDKS